MCRRVPIDFERLRILLGNEPEGGIARQRLGEVDQISVSLRDERGISQTRADLLGNLERSRALGYFFLASVRKLHMNAVSHKGKPVVVLNSTVYWTRFERGKLAITTRATLTHAYPLRRIPTRWVRPLVCPRRN